MIEANHLSGNTLNEVNFRLANGHRYGFFGEGADKMLSLLAGVVRPVSGECKINGFSLQQAPAKAKSCFSYLPKDFLPDAEMTVYEYLDFIGQIYGIPAEKRFLQVHSAMKYTGLDEFRDRLIARLAPADLPFLGLSALLASGREIFLMEDPTSSLSEEERSIYLDLLRELPETKTLLIFSEDPEVLASVADHLLLFANHTLTEESDVTDLVGNETYVLSLPQEDLRTPETLFGSELLFAEALPAPADGTKLWKIRVKKFSCDGEENSFMGLSLALADVPANAFSNLTLPEPIVEETTVTDNETTQESEGEKQ